MSKFGKLIDRALLDCRLVSKDFFAPSEKKLAVVILWFIFDSNSASKALKQDLRQTKINTMKTLIKSAIIGLALAGVAQAVPSSGYVTQNSTWSLTGSNQTFTFNQFNSALGNLTAVDLVINSSTFSGSVSITNTTGNVIDIDNIRSRIQVSGTGFTQFNTTNTAAGGVTPSVSGGYSLIGGANQNFTATTTSFLGLPNTTSIASGSFASYIGGSSTPSFTARLLNTVSSDADLASDLTNVFSFSSSAPITLRYTYTPSSDPSAVPEPGQVAASLLLLGGIGGYVFIKRRRKSAVAAA